MDVIGFLALGGLFTAHITGNLVILAAHYITGRFSEIGPFLSVPVFVAVLGAVTLASRAIEKAGYNPQRMLLVLQAALLAGCLGVGAGFGPFADADRPMAVFVGMLGVAAMATQNALVKLALPGVPSTAVMTTNITQLTIDLATLAGGWGDPDDLVKARRRAWRDVPVRRWFRGRLCRRGRPGSPFRPVGAGAAGRPRRARHPTGRTEATTSRQE